MDSPLLHKSKNETKTNLSKTVNVIYLYKYFASMGTYFPIAIVHVLTVLDTARTDRRGTH
jgi:hypothetical protein